MDNFEDFLKMKTKINDPVLQEKIEVFYFPHSFI